MLSCHYIQLRLGDLILKNDLESGSTIISSKQTVHCGQNSAGINPPEISWVCRKGVSYTGFAF